MHAVILSAGDGGRMGHHTEEVPKTFMEVGDRILYEYQKESIEPHVDAVTVVLGYRHEAVESRFSPRRTVVVEGWDEYENSESLHRALREIDDDVLVLNGDVVVTRDAISKVCRAHERADDRSVVACLPGTQTEHTAVQLDDDGRVVAYGKIPGHRHAGLGIIDEDHLDAAVEHLRNNRYEWYPTVYEEIETRGVRIPADSHLEINRPADKQAAKERLPLDSPRETEPTPSQTRRDSSL
ncbi:NTP transferase domain-containing protein [Halopelagius longus]|uniref:MobA-like NTP transferase domain-containing protein n=1 Tax=Halopelagius longus TaxID=1236180 RepID=A0A1H1GGI9_9EURY|nr:NTP transferase domain-containing protein [Halopelagius longus]RDI69610.1 sugar nucleotidyltransferase [Halopelagius longus]SDR12225.1 MobA-like NTP transferase domain-containing protein [Halopelagius longus]